VPREVGVVLEGEILPDGPDGAFLNDPAGGRGGVQRLAASGVLEEG